VGIVARVLLSRSAGRLVSAHGILFAFLPERAQEQSRSAIALAVSFPAITLSRAKGIDNPVGISHGRLLVALLFPAGDSGSSRFVVLVLFNECPDASNTLETARRL